VRHDGAPPVAIAPPADSPNAGAGRTLSDLRDGYLETRGVTVHGVRVESGLFSSSGLQRCDDWRAAHSSRPLGSGPADGPSRHPGRVPIIGTADRRARSPDQPELVQLVEASFDRSAASQAASSAPPLGQEARRTTRPQTQHPTAGAARASGPPCSSTVSTGSPALDAAIRPGASCPPECLAVSPAPGRKRPWPCSAACTA
jgi:hypothetical protein